MTPIAAQSPLYRAVCVHGHFYQPPRENPWLEVVEVEPSAAPYHNWNERITAECYGPNASARILEGPGEGGAERTLNNYSRISFNFGPTLLSWLEKQAPAVYAAVLAADRLGAERFSGHGGAMAQGYHHVILPLANDRDRRSQILWGLADFAHRFGRPAEGFWLPETAVDLASLEILAEQGTRFTLLEPRQARRVRPLRESGLPAGDWQPAPDGIDSRMPYRLHLPSGRPLDVFFYDGEISRGIAFDGLLGDGETFAGRLLAAFTSSQRAELVHVATDGESYGHHHRFGEMALAYTLERIEAEPTAELSNYGEFLAHHPPRWEVEIHENTAWSCAHGVERWRSDCGCSTGGEAGWNQSWRAPLREALDALRDELAGLYERAAGKLLTDPWAARDDYVHLVLARSSPGAASREADFFARQGRLGLDAAGRRRAVDLLEMQRHAMLMYTSCGWFFHDLAGLETRQVLRYAGRAIELGEALGEERGDSAGGRGLEDRFLARLALARSNDPQEGDGRRIYERHVGSARRSAVLQSSSN